MFGQEGQSAEIIFPLHFFFFSATVHSSRHLVIALYSHIAPINISSSSLLSMSYFFNPEWKIVFGQKFVIFLV